jgi:hypothetical protein
MLPFASRDHSAAHATRLLRLLHIIKLTATDLGVPTLFTSDVTCRFGAVYSVNR